VGRVFERKAFEGMLVSLTHHVEEAKGKDTSSRARERAERIVLGRLSRVSTGTSGMLIRSLLALSSCGDAHQRDNDTMQFGAMPNVAPVGYPRASAGSPPSRSA